MLEEIIGPTVIFLIKQASILSLPKNHTNSNENQLAHLNEAIFV